MNGFDPDAKNKRQSRNHAVNFDVSTLIRGELSGDERLIWQGQPIPSRMMFTAFAIYLFAIPWTAFSLFWEAMALSIFFGDPAKAPQGPEKAVGIIFPLFGLPFVLIGFGMLLSPFWVYKKAKTTVYAITDRRAIVIDGGRSRAVTSYPFEKWEGEITRKERTDGSGSLFFSTTYSRDSDGDVRVKKKGFDGIFQVRDVEAKLLRALEAYKARKNMPDSKASS